LLSRVFEIFAWVAAHLASTFQTASRHLLTLLVASW
jgi:hypothetical protein